MTPAELARRLFRDQCSIGPNSSLEAYGETAAVAAMVPLIEALDGCLHFSDALIAHGPLGNALKQWRNAAEQALTPQPEEVA